MITNVYNQARMLKMYAEVIQDIKKDYTHAVRVANMQVRKKERKKERKID